MVGVTVLGATGGIGRAVARELVHRGHAVRAVSRRGDAALPTGTERVTADLEDPDQAVAACAGADVVLMAANVPYSEWAARLPGMVDHAVAGASRAGARLVMVDNLYAYGAPDGPITETTPEAADTRKGTLRRRIGERILRAHREGRVSAAIGRFSDYYGPGGTNALVYSLGIEPALRGKPIRAFIDPDQLHTFHHLPDAAAGFATLVEQADADGRVWILPAAPAVTQRELLSLVAREAGRAPQVGRIGRPLLALGALFDRELRELRELTGQWDRPYVTDASAFEAAFGVMPTTPHPDAVATTVASFREQAPDGR